MHSSMGRDIDLLQCPYPQLVFFGDSLLEQSVRVQEGFSMQAALQSRETAHSIPCVSCARGS